MAKDLSPMLREILLRTLEITEASYDPAKPNDDEDGIDWEDAYAQTDAPPELLHVVITLLNALSGSHNGEYTSLELMKWLNAGRYVQVEEYRLPG